MPTKRALVLGGTGGCGSQALTQLLARGVAVVAVVRSASRLPDAARAHPMLTVVERPAGVLGMAEAELADTLRGCDAVVSCLGHNPSSIRALGDEPRRLCADSARKVCDTIRAMRPRAPVKLIVVSTALADHPNGSDPKRWWIEKLLLWALERWVPPHADNIATAAYLHAEVGAGEDRPNQAVEFCGVRPELLVQGEVGAYQVHKRRQNGIFGGAKTSRANVGHFMAELVSETEVWEQWKGQFPIVLNSGGKAKGE